MGVRLPPEYQETEWIEGTRNAQFIDSGIPGNINTLIIEAKVKPGAYSQYVPLWGNYEGENYNVTRLIAYAENSILSYINTKAGGGTSAVVIPPLFGTGKTFVIRQERTRLIIDGTAYTISASATASENSKNITINASRLDNPSTSNPSVQRWYYFRIFDGEAKLRDFVPCYRKSDDKPGMYDLVTETFLVNQGTGADFTVGPNVIDSISPWLFARRMLLMQKKPARLPAEYQEVEYLQTSQTGAPYIDSGVAITEDLVFEIDFQLLDVVRARYFMGAYDGYDFYLYVSGDSTPYFQTAFGSAWANTTLLADTQRHKFTYQFENEYLVVKDSNTPILTKVKTGFSTRHILVAGTSHAQNTRIPCRTYESKMTKSGVVIQDLIPCYRKVDDTPGMYDLVSNTFFTNTGTGEFIVGADTN